MMISSLIVQSPTTTFQHQQQRHKHQRHRSRPPMKALAVTGKLRDGEDNLCSQLNSSELEIEKKFCIPNEESAMRVEKTLTSLGFTMSHKEEFVDWYFDLPAPNWHFSLQDYWIRYREKKIQIANNWGWKGSWQVKRGNKDEDPGNINGMTVYEEFQGEDAKKLIRQAVTQQRDVEGVGASSEIDASFVSSGIHSHFDEHEVPYLAGAEGLVPFARIGTLRTCFEASNKAEFSNLKVVCQIFRSFCFRTTTI